MGRDGAGAGSPAAPAPSEVGAVRGALVLRRVRVVPWRRRRRHARLLGAGAGAADVLPRAVAVQRLQRVQDRAGNQVQLPRVPVCVCHHVILLAVTFCDGFVSLPVHRKR